jgi:hypothetical protein
MSKETVVCYIRAWAPKNSKMNEKFKHIPSICIQKVENKWNIYPFLTWWEERTST